MIETSLIETTLGSVLNKVGQSMLTWLTESGKEMIAESLDK